MKIDTRVSIPRFVNGMGLENGVGKMLINLVELVGIEPTTSSLRTMRSPS